MKLTKSDMEKMAEDLREKLEVANDQPLDPFQIEITDVHFIKLGDLQELPQDTKKYLEDEGQSNWSAMTVPLDRQQEKWAILFNASHDIERQRVSLLEEIWHIIQGHKLTSVIRVGSGFGRSFDESDEHDAYYLASATLLPEKSIRKYVREKNTAEAIAQRFGTSKELVEYRIKRLNLWTEYKGKEISLKRN